MRFLRGVLTAVIALALVLYFGVAATALVLRIAVMPHIDSFRPHVEATASEALGAKVSIVALSAHWQGLSPAIEIFGLTVRNRNGTVALSVPHASAVVAWRSLLHLKPLLVSLLVEHPDVLAVRHADGSFEVAGVPLKTDGGNKNQLAHWLFTQNTIVLRGGTLQWRDETRQVPDLTVRQIKLAIFNFGHSHRIGLQADGDGAVLQGPLDFRASFRHGVLADPGVPEGWLGRAYLQTNALDLPALSRYLDLPVEATRGQIGAQLVLSFARMKLTSVEGDLSGDALALRTNPQLPVIDAPSATLHFKLQHIDNTYQLAVRNLSITLTDETPLADGTPLERLMRIKQLDAVYRSPIPGHGQSFSIKGDLADVGLLASFSRKLPLPRSLSEQLVKFDPRGVIGNYTVAWERAAPGGSGTMSGNEAIIHYQLKADLDGISLAAQAPPPGLTALGHKHAGLPGFDNLSGHIDTTEKHGSLTLAAHHAAVTIDGLLDQPRIDFDTIAGHLIWDLGQTGTQPSIEVRSSDLTLSNADVALSTDADYRSDGSGRGMLDLTSHFSYMNLAAVARYMPSSLDPNLREFLGHALRSGTVNDATVEIQGKLDDFPFDRENKPGTFHISAPFHAGSFDPTPMPPVLLSNGRPQQWPVIEQISGNFDLNREQLNFTVDHGRYRRMALTNVHGHIADLSTRDNDMIVTSNAAGPLDDLLAYVGASPVSIWTGHVLDPLAARGPATLALSLSMPRDKGGNIHVHGTVGLHNDTVAYPDSPALSQLTGELQFTDRSVTLQRVTGQFLGDTLNAQGGINADGTIAATISGRLNAAALHDQGAQGPYGKLADLLSGSAAYSVSLHANHVGMPEITGSADLTGLAINLPTPLGKAVGSGMPLRFEVRPLDSDTGSSVKLASNEARRGKNNLSELSDNAAPAPVTAQIEAQIGPVSLAYLVHATNRDASLGDTPAARAAAFSPVVLRGAIGVNHPAVLPAHGVVATVTLPQLDADAWRDALARLPLSATPGTTDGGDIALQPFLPTQLNAHLGKLDLFARTWTNVAIDGSHLNDLWQAELNSDQLNGHLAWHAQSPLSEAGELDAHLTKLTIPSAHAGDSFMQALSTQPHRFPALDLSIDDFTAADHAFGKFELQARNLQRDGVPVWQIDQLRISNPAAKLSATGSWRIAGTAVPATPGAPTPADATPTDAALTNDPRRTELDFKLDINDAGALLNRLGLPRTLQQGNGVLAGHIGWHGGPDAIDAPTLAGNLSLDLHRGQILKVDPGIGKLLGVLSLQSLARFITFDFRGVTGSGLSFDAITASSKIAQGVARTDDFKLNSSAAHVSMKGTADMVHETQNLRVMVVPTLSASSAALAATVINPLLGLGSFVAQWVLSDSLSKALALNYSVTGSWAAPEIRQIKGHESFVNPADAPAHDNPSATAP